jgi:hypothetical protein
MNVLAICPGCGFRGRLPGTLTGIKTIICPNCKVAVPTEEIRQSTEPSGDGMFPIWVDGTPQPRRDLVLPREEVPPVREEAPPVREKVPPVPQPEPYPSDFMKDEVARFNQYVTARLTELHKRRLELAEAEHRFESMTMEKKQELYRAQAAASTGTEQLREREAAVQAKEAEFAAIETALTALSEDLTAREARVARSEARALDAERRTAELRATIEKLEATRTALAEERAELSRSADALAQRAEALDRAELALHRRFAELDEITS